MMPLLSHLPSSGQIADNLLKNRGLIAGCVFLMTLLLSVPASRVRLDPSGVSFNTENFGVYED